MDITNMTPEEKRITIAEALGFQWVALDYGAYRESKLTKDVQTDPPLDGTERCRHWSWDRDVPDYLNDLNAMHDAEKQVHEGFSSHLRRVVSKDLGIKPFDLCDEYLIHATATQRADAFILSLP